MEAAGDDNAGHGIAPPIAVIAMTPTNVELVASALFALAILHTFSVNGFQHLAQRYAPGSVGENFFHLLGEVEIAFGLWAAVFVAYLAVAIDTAAPVAYLEQRDFTEPAFVFVIMAMAATRPVVHFAAATIGWVGRALPLSEALGFYVAALSVGPLLGSFITEPAAMTVTALLLKDRFFAAAISRRLKYATLGVLFVNVSIGGVLTHFAAPPVLMVAGVWEWDSLFMVATFGWKATIAVILNTAMVAFLFRQELCAVAAKKAGPAGKVPRWLIALHLLFLALVVVTAHHMVVFIGLFLFFLGLTVVTQEYQRALQLRESLMVGFFLAGLVVLGGMQSWWLGLLIDSLDALPLFLGATALTAITDNAALTYLGAQIPDIAEELKYVLVAGAVAGGGLTVIANAPNPAGYAILRENFGDEGISPAKLFAAAALPTAVTMFCFWWL